MLGLVVAGLGLVIGLLSLFVLDWAEGDEGGFGDVRELIDRAGPDFGALPNSLVISGAYTIVFVGAIIALGRAAGLRPARLAALAVAVLASVALIGVGVAAISIDSDLFAGARPTAVPSTVPDAGSPITQPDGTPITGPDGSPLTVPEGPVTGAPEPEADPSGSLFSNDELRDGERRLAAAAVVSAVLILMMLVLAAIGLLLRGAAGRVLCAVSLGIGLLWAVGGLLVLDGHLDDLGTSLQPGAWLLPLSALLLAVGAILPPFGRRT